MILDLETLESLIEVNKKFATDYFKEHGELRPMAVGYTPDNKNRIVILGGFSDDQSKAAWQHMVSLVFLLYDVDKYVVMHEGWALLNPSDDPYRYGSLADHPDRVEVLNIVAVNRHGAKMSISQILEDRSLKELPFGDGGEVRGSFCDLLSVLGEPRRKLTDGEKKELRKLLETMPYTTEILH